MKKIAIKQTKDQVAEIIKADILSGVLKSDDTLTQEQVAAKTGLSRMPVREAFQTLEQDGFLVRLPNRHVRAVEMTNENIDQYFHMLATMETCCCSYILQKDDQAQALENFIQQAIDAESSDAEAAIHSSIIAMLHNEYLSNMLQKMLNGFYRYALKHFWQPERNHASLIMMLDGIDRKDESMLRQGLEQYFAFYALAMKER